MLDVVSIFEEVGDPRDANARHDLAAILFIALAATLCGAKSCVEIADFAAANEAELAEMVDLAHGAPSHDTFSRVLRLLDPAELARAFAGFLAALREGLGLEASAGIVAVDGKSLRRGYERGKAHMPPLLVNVFDCQTRLAIASARAPGGSEVAGTLSLLKGLVLKGCTVTADALHCRADTAQAILAAKAHYVLALKANQPLLLRDVEAAFAAQECSASHELKEASHDREECRRATILPAAALGEKHGFPKLAAIGRIASERTLNGRTSSATRFYILSCKLTPKRLLETVRGHWAIENRLHWTLDVVFHEDDARARKNYAPENLALIRRIALNILRAHPSPKSIRRKMNLARWKKDFFFELFTHMR